MPPKDEQLRQAAEWRANGYSWDYIARKLELPVNEVSRWPELDGRRWRRLYDRARNDLIDESSSEAIQTLRTMLRVDDAKVQREAAMKLVMLQIATSKKPGKIAKYVKTIISSSPYRRMVQYLEGLSDDELQRIAERGGTVPPELREPTQECPTVAE